MRKINVTYCFNYNIFAGFFEVLEPGKVRGQNDALRPRCGLYMPTGPTSAVKKHFPKQSTARRGKASKNARGQDTRKDNPPPVVRCNPALLAPNNSYGTDFMLRGFYADKAFCCVDCGKNEIWSATQQKWWYEIAKGNVNSTATRCRACRRRQRERTDEARRVQREGSGRKRGVCF